MSLGFMGQILEEGRQPQQLSVGAREVQRRPGLPRPGAKASGLIAREMPDTGSLWKLGHDSMGQKQVPQFQKGAGEAGKRSCPYEPLSTRVSCSARHEWHLSPMARWRFGNELSLALKVGRAQVPGISLSLHIGLAEVWKVPRCQPKPSSRVQPPETQAYISGHVIRAEGAGEKATEHLLLPAMRQPRPAQQGHGQASARPVLSGVLLHLVG